MAKVTDERLFAAARHAFGPYEYLFRGWYHIFSNHELTEAEKNKYEEEALSVEAKWVGDITKDIDRQILEDMRKEHPEYFKD